MTQGPEVCSSLKGTGKMSNKKGNCSVLRVLSQQQNKLQHCRTYLGIFFIAKTPVSRSSQISNGAKEHYNRTWTRGSEKVARGSGCGASDPFGGSCTAGHITLAVREATSTHTHTHSHLPPHTNVYAYRGGVRMPMEGRE